MRKETHYWANIYTNGPESIHATRERARIRVCRERGGRVKLVPARLDELEYFGQIEAVRRMRNGERVDAHTGERWIHLQEYDGTFCLHSYVTSYEVFRVRKESRRHRNGRRI